jgi:hypothetical protein
MRFDVRAVEQDFGRRTASRCERGKRFLPHTLRPPAHEPVVQRLVWPIDNRRVFSAAARLQYMDDPADDTMIVDPRHTACIRRQKCLKPRELLLRQPKLIRHPITPIVWELESDRHRFANPLYGS